MSGFLSTKFDMSRPMTSREYERAFAPIAVNCIEHADAIAERLAIIRAHETRACALMTVAALPAPGTPLVKPWLSC
jgi:hypothetical protein